MIIDVWLREGWAFSLANSDVADIEILFQMDLSMGQTSPNRMKDGLRPQQEHLTVLGVSDQLENNRLFSFSGTVMPTFHEVMHEATRPGITVRSFAPLPPNRAAK